MKPITTVNELVEYLFINGGWNRAAVLAKVNELVENVQCKHGIERELEAVNVVDNLLVLMREQPGWDFNGANHAFSYLRRMKHSYSDIPLTVSVADELRRRES